ncbi:RHS repeat-associated core domain-containing protein [Glycomyces sp. MUSA5-2]|uniref:RHS repeat-associated core domain-containing protein n=1 Tax=Glycomyces sp. MUSA5-2 TaxID=2053002 RepID=UPI0030095F44
MRSPELTPLLPAVRLSEARRKFTVAASGLILLSGLAVAGMPLPYFASVPDAPEPGDIAEGRNGDVRDREENELAVEAPVEAAWPGAGTIVLDLEGGSAAGEIGGLPITVSKVNADSPDDVEVGLLPAEAADAAGITGVLLAVAAEGGEVEIEVGYGTLAGYYGGSYGSRLAAWALPDCAVVTDRGCAAGAAATPARNDTEVRTLTFTVDTSDGHTGGAGFASGHGSVATTDRSNEQASDAATTSVVALAADDASAGGDYAATALAPSSEWTHGGSSGAFNWSYGIDVPTVIGDLAPGITLSYSSQSSDGRTSATNNQGSWIGEGFTYEPGYIERSYQSCSDDGHEDVAGAGDQCWAWDNASIVLGDTSGELVNDGDTWRVSGDDGSKVERLTGADNGDNDGEYWKVTTTDGTQYFFGRHRLPGYESTDTATNSTWTVPVFGDDSGEECYNATFEDAYCDQAWRWNLDFVVDPLGNAMSYYYAKETNYYARHGDTTVDGDAYTRGGYLKSIQYGLRSSDAYTTAPAQVLFTVDERCLELDASIDCSASALAEDTAADWPDVPFDRNCASGTECEATQSSPTFWTRKRLTGITTRTWNGTGYTTVDSWALTHSFVDNGDTTRTLWLDSITRTGHTGTPITLPPTTFLPVQKVNRVDEIGDSIAPLIRPRMATVYTDTGGQIDVVYDGSDCAPDDTPTPATNERRCYPVIWQPGSYDDDITDWFNKYVVSEVTVSDRTGESPSQVTRFAYSNPGWRKAEYQGIGDEATFTWSDWRGYGTVTTTSAPGMIHETKAVTKYYQGMHGDETASGGTRTVTLTDALGYEHTDYEQLSGSVLDQITYNDGQIVAKTSSSYWRHITATDTHSWGDLEAAFVRSDTTRTDELKADGTWRRTSTDSDWDSTYGLVSTVDDFGDGATSADNRCTRYEYAHNTSAHLIDFTKRVETVAVKCETTPNRATQVITDVRTSYDNAAYGTPPTQGLSTTVAELASHDGTTATYATTATMTYDAYGRALTVKDANNNTTTTAYTDTALRNTGNKVTNALGHAVTTVYDPARHLPLTVTDANSKTTTQRFDALGRVTETWMSFQNPNDANQSPYQRYSYAVSDSDPIAITTEQLEQDLTTYTKTVEIYDGLTRHRQTQATGPEGGRLVTDTVYDELGRTAQVNDVYYAAGAPTGILLVVEISQVDMSTLSEYDDLGRVTADITVQAGVELWRTETTYSADQSTVTAPEGGTAARSFTDARGNTTALWQYLDNEPIGDPQITEYTYTPAGNLAAVTDFDDNAWTFTYNQRGRKIQSVDPDTGIATYTYDAVGNLTTATDARGQVITTVYDALSRPTATWDGPASTAAGGVQLTKRTWDTQYKGYEFSNVSYEESLTVTTTTLGRNWAYLPVGTRVALAGTAAGSLATSYITSTAYNIDGSVQSRAWNAFGGLDSESVAYTRDLIGRITQVDGIDGVYADNVNYKRNGLLSTAEYPTDAASVLHSWYYGEGNRVSRTLTEALDRSGSLTNTTYDYDDAGNVLSVIDSPNAEGMERQAECYTYDGLRRLTEAWTTAAAGTDSSACTGGPETTGVDGAAAYWQSFTFDAAGNRTSLTDHDTTGSGTDQTWNYTFGTETAHALETVTEAGTTESTAFEYDQVGNTTGVDSSTGFTQDITWDATGKVETITTTGSALSSSGAVSGESTDGTIQFYYDADGTRIMRSTATEATLYVAGVEITLNKTTGTVSSTRSVDLPGGVTRIEQAGGTAQLQLADHHGTGTLAFDCFTGDVTRRYSDPYGNNLATATTAADGDPEWLGQNGYVKGTIDPTGYTHIGARDYNPTTGRFLSVDPIGDLSQAQQLNGYAYSDNNPTSFSDPTGLKKGSRNMENVGGNKGEKKHAKGGGGCGAPNLPNPCGGGNGGGRNGGGGGGEDYPGLQDVMDCNNLHEGSTCATTTSTDYIVPGNNGTIMIDLWIESETEFLHGNERGLSTDPTEETKVKIFWNTETGQLTIISDHTCTDFGSCHDARESCIECEEMNSVELGEIETSELCSFTGCDYRGPSNYDEWNGFSFEVDAAESFSRDWWIAAPLIPNINRTISIGFHESGSGIFIATSGDTYPSLAVVQYQDGGTPEVLASSSENDLNDPLVDFPTGLLPGGPTYEILRSS